MMREQVVWENGDADGWNEEDVVGYKSNNEVREAIGNLEGF